MCRGVRAVVCAANCQNRIGSYKIYQMGTMHCGCHFVAASWQHQVSNYKCQSEDATIHIHRHNSRGHDFRGVHLPLIMSKVRLDHSDRIKGPKTAK